MSMSSDLGNLMGRDTGYEGGRSRRISSFEQATSEVNVGRTERWISMIGGGALALAGLWRGSLGGLAMLLGGAGLIQRGVTGFCPVNATIGRDSAHRGLSPSTAIPSYRGFKVEKVFTVNRPPEELYHFWRDLENLPRIMQHLSRIDILDEQRSHWVARFGGVKLEWDALIINDRPNELIGWRSLDNADVAFAGSVHFKPAPGGRGTEMKVVLKYDPPGGRVTNTFARLVGKNPAKEIEEELRHFKQVMEAGEIPRVRAHQFSAALQP